MRTETPRTRQLTFQLGYAPCVLTRRALAAGAAAPSHPLSAGRSKKCFTRAGGVIAERADAENRNPVFLYSQEERQRLLHGPKHRISARDMR